MFFLCWNLYFMICLFAGIDPFLIYFLIDLWIQIIPLYSDAASKAFDNTDTSLFATIRPDFLVMNNETGLVVIEVKPLNTSHSLLEADEIRTAEMTKKNEKEFSSFGIMIAGKYNILSFYYFF